LAGGPTATELTTAHLGQSSDLAALGGRYAGLARTTYPGNGQAPISPCQQDRVGAQPKTDRVFTMEATAAVLRVGSRVALIQIDHTEMLGGIPAAIITAAAERVR
jgi:hypothetical protein